jgi:DNA-entry nuclease
MNKKWNLRVIALFCAILFLLSGCGTSVPELTGPTETQYRVNDTASTEPEITEAVDPAATEATATESESGPSATDGYGTYAGHAWVEINGNIPYFTEDEKNSTEAFEIYSDLDSLGRCGVAYVNICKELMPTEERGEIGSVKPSGWHTVKYPEIISGNYLYNRCHLIGYQLAGENANEKNLITGTRYLNVTGMLPFENEVDDYVDSTGNHVLYRVTPVFTGDNLVADGVLMEAWSVEDHGTGVCFNVFCYNVQPGIAIDYATGDSWEDDSVVDLDDAVDPFYADKGTDTGQPAESTGTESTENGTATSYVLNTNTMKFHYPSCSSVSKMSEKNRKDVDSAREDLISQGYDPCGICNP